MKSCLLVVGLLAGCGHAPGGRVEPGDRAPPSHPLEQAAPTARPAADAWPGARTVDVTETRFGITVSDPYRWMEGEDNPELAAWLDAQGDRTRAYLARIPGRDALLARVRELGNATETANGALLAAGKLFYFKTSPGDQLAKIMVREGGKERMLVEPAKVEGAEGHASLDGFSPSPDGRKLAYNVSRGGGEVAVIHVLDVATGKTLPDRVERTFGALQ